MSGGKYSELFELAIKIATQEIMLEFLEKRLATCYGHPICADEKKIILLRMIEEGKKSLQKDKEAFEQALYYAGKTEAVMVQ